MWTCLDDIVIMIRDNIHGKFCDDDDDKFKHIMSIDGYFVWGDVVGKSSGYSMWLNLSFGMKPWNDCCTCTKITL